MGKFRTRFIKSRDGTTLRTAVWDDGQAVHPRVCTILGGQTEYLEKYEEVAGELAARGFAVATFDWRSQGGSARPLSDPLKVHVDDFARYDDDLAEFLDQVVAPLSSDPPLALAHSMGGHILLRTLHDRPERFAGAVLSAPMIQAVTAPYPASVARFICRLQNLTGQKNAWVWGMAGRDPLKLAFEDNRVTSDRGRYMRNRAVLEQDQGLRTAGATWGWLEAAYRSMARQAEAGFVEAIRTPVLVLGAGGDRIVETSATRALAARLPNGTYVELPASEHEILMETDPVREQFWQAFERFLADRVAGRAPIMTATGTGLS
jgi:lysophospholipase